jgi:hypothetical protein
MGARGALAAAVFASAIAGCSSSPPAEEAPSFTPWAAALSGMGPKYLQAIAAGPSGEVAITGSFPDEVGLGDRVVFSNGGEDAFTGVLESDGRARWVSDAGDDASQAGVAVAFAPDGDLLAAGAFSGSITFGSTTLTSSGGQLIYVTRFDPSGNVRWSKEFGGDPTGGVHLYAMAAEADGGFVLGGSFNGSVNFGGGVLTANAEAAFVARFDREGGHVYSFRFAGGSQLVEALAVDASGAAVVAGTVSGSIGITDNPDTVSAVTVFVARLENDGHPTFLRLFGGHDPYSQASLHGVAVDPITGAVVFSARAFGSLRLGDVDLGLHPGGDAFVAKLAPRGDLLWLREYGSSNTLGYPAIDGRGHVLLGGAYSGTPLHFGGGSLPSAGASTLFLAELDAAGGFVEAQAYGDGKSSFLDPKIALDPAGGLAVAGTLLGSLKLAGQSFHGDPETRATIVARLRVPFDPPASP